MIRILFLAANPDNADTLLAGDELRQIEAALKHTRFQVIAKPAARLADLRGLLQEYKPQIVHFSGHGSQYGELLLVNDRGQSQPAAAPALTNLFRLFNRHLRCVILNACYTDTQAVAIGAAIDCVLGFAGAIRDDAARAFAAGFYSALAAGETVAVAKDHGLNEIELHLPDALQPCHLGGRGDPATLRPLDWADEASSVPSPPTSRGIFGLYPFNEHFFGRDNELAELHSLLQAQAAVSICPVITGMGGLGKTQLAAHYARDHVADYPAGIFWITAADLNEIRPQLADFCVALGLPVADPQRSGDLTEQKITAFKHYLDQHPRTLLIFDNVEEPEHLRTRQISGHWTALTLGGKVLITTRRRKLPGDRFAELALQRLLSAPARQILTTARAELAADPDLDRLCEQFGYLPLMLNLAAAALKKRGGAIAGYLQKLQTLGAEKLHSEVAKVSLADYHHSLSAVLHEQWAMLHDDNARLLLRVAGQLPEAAVIPTARLGLLAGLADVDEWERSLSDALEELEAASLIERVDEATLRLHPLVRDFAFGLLNEWERYDFCHECARNLAVYFENLSILESNCRTRGIASVISDILIARYFLFAPLVITPFPRPIPKLPDYTELNLYTLLRVLRRESHNLQDNPTFEYTRHFLQQYLYRTWTFANESLMKQADELLTSRYGTYFKPIWAVRRESLNLEQTLIGHEDEVSDVAVLDAQRIVSASADCTLKVWNLQTGAVEQTLIGHKQGVKAVAALDERHIISASADHTLKVWNLQTGIVQQTLTGHDSAVNAVVVLDRQRIVSASNDCTIRVWNLLTGQVEHILKGHKDGINAIAVVNTQCIVSASSDCTLIIWDLRSNQIDQILESHSRGVLAVAVLDAQRVISGSDDHTLKIWNLRTRIVEQTLEGHKYGVNGMAILDTQCIISASSDRTLRIWDLRTDNTVEQALFRTELTGHEAWVNTVAKLDAQRIISASSDRTLKIWDVQNSVVEQPLFKISSINHEDWINALSVVNTERILSVSRRALKVWNLSTGVIEQTLKDYEDWVNAVVVQGGERIIWISKDHLLKTWNLRTDSVECISSGTSLAGHEDSVTAVTMIDNQRIISASYDYTLKIWNVDTGEIEQTLEGHDGGVLTVALLDTRHIISGSNDHTLKVWNLGTGEIEQTLEDHKDSVRAVAKLDEQQVISASSDQTLKVWNVCTGQVTQTLEAHNSAVLAIAVLDAEHVVSSAYDRTLKVWNLATGQLIAAIGLDGAPRCVAVTRQGDRTLIVAGDAAGALYCLELVEPR